MSRKVNIARSLRCSDKLIFVSVFIRFRTKTLSHTCSVLESEQSQMEVVQKTMFSINRSQNVRKPKPPSPGTRDFDLCRVVRGCANLYFGY